MTTAKNPIVSEHTSGEHEVRKTKVEAMRQAGIEPWPATQPIDATCKDVIDEFNPDQESRVYAVAGRVVGFREHGKTAFANIQDRTGKLQVYIRADAVGQETFEQLQKYIDVGDFIWVSGSSFKTKTGEITLKAQQVMMVSKSLHPLPEKFHGLADIETVYRQRYLDLISNAASRQRFMMRSTIIRIMRNFLDAQGFMEVETPMLHPIPGGAAARPFVTHHNALDSDFYLRIAPELYLKRLVVGGFERVYEINRNFRNEGISTRHNPEFTMIEFYTAYQDYHWVMTLVETLMRTIVMQTCEQLTVPFGEKQIDFGAPFTRLSMQEAVARYAGVSPKDLEGSRIDAFVQKYGVTFPVSDVSWGQKLYGLFEKIVEPQLEQPTFITEFPVEVSPLAKRNANNPAIVDRFELFIGGMELSNGFNELNDPFDQAARFREQAAAHEAGDAEAHHYDADYILALEHGLPPTVGVGIGIDRFTMLLTNTTSIKDVILFPTLKNKES